MKPFTLDRYKDLLARLDSARAESTATRARYEEAVAHEQALASQVADADAHIERALAALNDSDARARRDDGPTRDVLDELLGDALRTDAPDGIRPSFWEVLRLIPDDGHVGLSDLRPHFKLTEGALGARLGKCKQAGLIESAGWGRYSLTEKARKLMTPRLRVVTSK